MTPGGEIFVLDMGEPVKIDTLARNLIRLSGYEPDVDIQVVYTHLRPGEKLYEEKLMAEEGMKKTANDLIHIGKPMPKMPNGSFAKKLYSLYLTYLPKEKFRYAMKMNVDDRGSFTELVHTADCGQVSINISKPGITKIVAEDRTGNDSVFYHQDLIAYNKKLETIGERYRNTTKDWDKYYKAAIVAPIRIANKRLFYTSDNNAYNLLGFLCADTLDTHSFTKQNKETYTYLVKAYAATLYNILSKYQFYMKQLSTNSDSVSVNSIKKIPTAQNQTYRNKNTNKSRRRK